MKKVSKLMSIVVATVMAIGMSNNIAQSAQADFKYAVVDVQKVVASSKQVTELKNQQITKLKDLSTFIQNANKQLQAEKDPKKKQALEAKLTKQAEDKKVNIDNYYATKLAEIDKNISNIIATQAKKQGYNLVLAKGVVLYSEGVDITNQIIQAVK